MKTILTATTSFLCLMILIFSPLVTRANDFRLRLNQLDESYTEEDIQVEIEFGRNLAARILSSYEIVDDPKLLEYLNLLGKGIAAQVGRPELNYYFAVIDTPDINAYACPGGYIFITKGAIDLMENEAQLAGVIAHEIWHVNFRHVVRPLKIRAKGDSVTSGVASAFGSGTAVARVALNQLTEKAFKLLFEEGISKELEMETDSAAIETLVTLDYHWKSYQDYIQSVDSDSNSVYTKVLSKTHPTIAQRIDSMKRLALALNLNAETGKTNAKRYQLYLTQE